MDQKKGFGMFLGWNSEATNCPFTTVAKHRLSNMWDEIIPVLLGEAKASQVKNSCNPQAPRGRCGRINPSIRATTNGKCSVVCGFMSRNNLCHQVECPINIRATMLKIITKHFQTIQKNGVQPCQNAKIIISRKHLSRSRQLIQD